MVVALRNNRDKIDCYKNVETKLTVPQNVRIKKEKRKKRNGITFIIMTLFHKIIRSWLFMYLETLKKRKAKEKKRIYSL